MTTIYFVRHGEKAWANGRRGNRPGSQYDPPLAGLGLLPDTVNYLREELGLPPPVAGQDPVTCHAFDAIYCSPFLRTRETMEHLCAMLHISTATPIRYDVRVAEYLGNLRRSDVVRHVEPDTAELFPHQAALNGLGRETFGALGNRVQRFLRTLPAGGRYLVVTHGLVARLATAATLEQGGVQKLVL